MNLNKYDEYYFNTYGVKIDPPKSYLIFKTADGCTKTVKWKGPGKPPERKIFMIAQTIKYDLSFTQSDYLNSLPTVKQRTYILKDIMRNNKSFRYIYQEIVD